MIRRTTLALGALTFIASVASAQARTVTITASDFKFDAPDSIAAGLTTFELINKGTEMHHMQIIRLEQGKTMADVNAALQNPAAPPPAWVTLVGGPNGAVPHGPAVSVAVSLTPGQYVLLCFIPSPDGKPHVAKGMVRPLTVVGGASVAQAGLPKADNVMTLYDYNFDLDKPLTAGRRTIQIRNTGKQFHEVFIAKLPTGTPVTAMMEWLSGGMKGPPPVLPVGGIVGITAGEVNFATVDLEPGEYGLYCFLVGPDGKEHVQHGMFKKITVGR